MLANIAYIVMIVGRQPFAAVSSGILMTYEFNELPWHDAEIHYVGVDRRLPGERDQITIDVRWPNGSTGRLTFLDCYELEARMNFGVIAPESILDASVASNSEELVAIRSKWAALGSDLRELKCFEVQTSSTNSVLRIYALSCEIQRRRELGQTGG